jgi:hypothetical protein
MILPHRRTSDSDANDQEEHEDSILTDFSRGCLILNGFIFCFIGIMIYIMTGGAILMLALVPLKAGVLSFITAKKLK